MKQLATSNASRIAIAVLVIALIFIASLSLGATRIPSLFSVLTHPFSTMEGSEIVWQIRFPRALAALCAGAALGIAGLLAQGALSNPLAEPSIIGASAGAALATVIGVLVGVASIGSVSAFICAVVGAAAATYAVTALARKSGRFSSLKLIIIGFSLSAALTAIVALLTSIVSRADARSISFWSFGSLALAGLDDALLILAVLVIVALVVPRKIDDLDVMSLGDLRARLLGINVEHARLRSLVLMSLLVGAVVSTIGNIAFLALVAPHIARFIVGPRHKRLIAASAYIGAVILLISDLAARIIAPPHELNVGLFTALLGAPILIWLVKR